MLKRERFEIKLKTKAEPVLRLWVFRILVELDGYQEWMGNPAFNISKLAEMLGLTQLNEFGRYEYDQKDVARCLHDQYKQAEKKAFNTHLPPGLESSVEQLARLVDLSDVDCRILEFAIYIHYERILDAVASYLGDLSSNKVFHALAVILRLPEASVREALSGQGILSRSGLVVLDRNGTGHLRDRLNLLSDAFADCMVSGEAEPLKLLRGTVSTASQPELSLADYAHIQPNLNILVPYLRYALKEKRKGVNVFVHGVPGTGKSQLARVLAQVLQCELFEVANEDSDGDPIKGTERLHAFRAAQCFFAKRASMMVFDEVEDVFNDGADLFGMPSTAKGHKAWINRSLEENPVPTIWLSNSAGLDPAFMRRFDMVFELPVPPKAQRARILGQQCEDIVEAGALLRLAEVEQLAPAVVARASSVMRAVSDELGAKATAEGLERLLSNTLEAQGFSPLQKHDANRLPDIYDPRFVNASADLSAFAVGIGKSRSARLCLYGPPGTGKTAFARWLAQELGMPLMIKRASDLMSMWVGGNEKNIAEVFRQAEQDGALLLIDEVDSFLQDRRGAQRSWEVSSVNEMLTQLESFGGVFIASTNLMGGLDQAALRRFDLKLKFDFLRTEQAIELLQCHCKNQGLLPAAEMDIARLSRLDRLTPGDFATVMRRNRFSQITTAAELVVALEAECGFKEGSKNAIGFV